MFGLSTSAIAVSMEEAPSIFKYMDSSEVCKNEEVVPDFKIKIKEITVLPGQTRQILDLDDLSRSIVSCLDEQKNLCRLAAFSHFLLTPVVYSKKGGKTQLKASVDRVNAATVQVRLNMEKLSKLVEFVSYCTLAPVETSKCNERL